MVDAEAEHDTNALTRVTLADAKNAISVAVPAGLGMALIAALGADPGAIETLLRATDAIYQGTTELIVGALIEHDRAILRARAGLAPMPTLRPECDAWTIDSRTTFGLARRPAPGGLLWFDLVNRILSHRDLPWPVEPFGEIPIFDGQNYSLRTVTYDVRGRWKVQAVK